MTHSRRNFLVGGLSAGAALPFLPNSLWGMANAMAASGKILVVIQVDGGWDYFNQIVPVESREYYDARPVIGLPDKPGAVLPIASTVAQKWAVFAQPLKDLYDRGDLAVINNVGYPNPNLSHFESQARWYTAQSELVSGANGWLAEYLRKGYSGPQSVPALDVSSRATGAFDGARVPVIGSSTTTIGFDTDPQTPADNMIEQLAMEVAASVPRPPIPNLRYTADCLARTFELVRQLRTAGQFHTPRVTYPYDATLTPFLYKIAALITQGFPSHVLYLRTGAFDHHAQLADQDGKTGTFARMFGALAGNLKAFLDDLKAYGKSQQVAVLLFSEFSRRFGQNGSLGTDHGHGGVAYVAGEPVQGGWYGKYPDLGKATAPYADWYPGYDKDSVDYRQVYATLLDKWLGVSSKTVLGGQYQTLPIF
jgi:uncharacterized protein (DUF1501 family)